jgi:hypothetical protein
MNIGLLRVKRNHIALKLEQNNDVRPFLWLYEHFLREAIKFPFENPVHEMWGHDVKGPADFTMYSALCDGLPYVYLPDSATAGVYCKGLSVRPEWKAEKATLERIDQRFQDIQEGKIDEMLFEGMLYDFSILCDFVCNSNTLDDAYELALTEDYI